MDTFAEKEKRALVVLVSIFVILATGILVVGYVAYQNYERQYRAQVESQLSAIADLKVGELVAWRSERFADATVIYKNTAFSVLVRRISENSQDVEAQEQLKTWLIQVQSSYGYDRVFLLDSKGVERMAVPDPHKPVASMVTQRVSEALRSGQVTMVDFYRNEYDQRIYLTTLVPVLDGQDSNRAIGILALRVDPQQYLYPFINRWPTPSATAETLIVRRDGNDALFLNELRFQKDAALNLRIPLENTGVASVKAALGQTGIVEAVDYRGEPVLADVRPVPDSPWFLVTRMDDSEIYAPVRERLWEMIVFVSALLFGAGASVGLIWRRQRAGFYRERYEAAEALRVISSRQEALLAAVPDIIMEVDNHQVYTWANHPGSEFFGEDVIGKEAAFYFEGEQDTYQTVKPIFNGKENTVYVESWQRRKDGENRLLAWWCRVLKDGNGNVTGALSSARDITEQKRAEEEIQKLNAELEQRVVERTAQLQAANQELEAFTYTVSHDLRSPLRAIDGFSRIIIEDYAGKLDAEGNRLLNVVRTNARKMDQLITELLTLSRITRGEMQSTRIDMTALAQTIYQEIASPEVQATFAFSVAPLLAAFGDPTLLRQVWSNLISNAIKYTMPKNERRIEIGCRVEDGMNVYYVQDNGVGFNPAYTAKLFGVFQRLHKAEEFEGTGVGLAIVQRVVHRHGGRVWAEGNINQGATFYFALPQKAMTL